jgi:hypothetical protein
MAMWDKTHKNISEKLRKKHPWADCSFLLQLTFFSQCYHLYFHRDACSMSSSNARKLAFNQNSASSPMGVSLPHWPPSAQSGTVICPYSCHHSPW